MFAALLGLLGAAPEQPEKAKRWIADRLPLTPLERLAALHADAGDDGFRSLALNYARYLRVVRDPKERARFGTSECDPEALHALSELEQSSSALSAGLRRFFLSRRGDWSESFFESWLL